MKCTRTALACLATIAALATFGCGFSGFSNPSTTASTLPAVSGSIHGGQQPVSGSLVQLYAANSSTSKGASTPLLRSAVSTDADGSFTITGNYTCPTGATQVYLVATGGNPGFRGNQTNPNLAMMAALGSCGNLTSSTFINVNELTTVAGVVALAPFMADLSHVGSDAANATGLAGAFIGAEAMVDFSTGQPPTSPSGLTPPVAILNTLANILAACINSAGGTAGDGSACGTLFQYATNGTTTDTLTAMLHIAQLPGQNVAQIFAIVSPTSPFQPVIATAPSSWILPLSISLPNLGPGYAAYHIVVDKAQHIWVDLQTLSGFSYTSGPLVVYDTNGSLLFTIQPGAGGLNAPLQMLADPLGNVWTINRNFTLSKFDPNGAPLSPSGGFPLPVSATQPPPALVFLAGTSSTGVIDPGPETFGSFDPSGNLWGLGSGTTSNCLIEVNNAGSVITPSANLCTAAGNALTLAVANDGAGNVWVTGSGSVSKGDPSGTFLTSGVNSNGCFSLNSGNFSPATLDTETVFLTYDRLLDRLWGTGGESLGVLRADGSQVFCKSGTANLPVLPLQSYVSRGCGCTLSYGVDITSSALDGAGTMWFITEGIDVLQTSDDYDVANYDALNAVDSTGRLLEPYATFPILPNFAGGLGTFGLSDAPTIEFLDSGHAIAGASIGGTTSQHAIAIDAYGNIWTAGTPVGSTANRLVKIPGLAAPKV